MGAAWTPATSKKRFSDRHLRRSPAANSGFHIAGEEIEKHQPSRMASGHD
jgi:hypothetical protein